MTLSLSLRKHALKLLPPLLLVMVVIAPALRPAEKYLGSWLWWFPYAITCLATLYYIFNNQSSWLAKLISSSGFIFGIPITLALISTAFYPSADSLKLIMEGQDQDDCTILGVNAILSGSNPVATPTYFGNPCSNLLGAIFPHIPFVLADLMGLAGPVFFLATVTYLFRRGMPKLELGLFVAVLAGTPATLELMVNGSDFVFIGFGVLWSLFALDALLGKANGRSFALLTLIVSLVASSRINMPIFAVPFGIAIMRARGQFTLFFAIVSVLILVPNGLVFLSSPSDFAPLHLLQKGQSLVPGVFYPLMIVVSILVIAAAWRLFVLRRIFTGQLVMLSFAPHLLFLAYGDLVFNRQFDIFWWEGANYLFLITPICTYLYIKARTSRPASTKEA